MKHSLCGVPWDAQGAVSVNHSRHRMKIHSSKFKKISSWARGHKLLKVNKLSFFKQRTAHELNYIGTLTLKRAMA